MAKKRRRTGGLVLKPGKCRVVKGSVRVCVSRAGKISVSSAGPKRKRKAPKRRKTTRRKTTKRKTVRRKSTKRRKTRRKTCVTGGFKLRTKKGVRCACGVRGKKRGSLRLQQISMKHPKCRAGIPGPMSWRAYKEKRSGVAKRRIYSV